MIRWLATVLIGAVGGIAWAGAIPPPVPDISGFPLGKIFGLPPQTPHPAVVRVVVQERGGMSLGSGALAAVQGPYGLVLTNWHVVRDAAGPITVIFPDGFRSEATVLKVDAEWDLAALAIWRPRTTPIPLATQMPQLGETLTIVGYGSGPYRAATGRCLQYLSPGRNQPPEMIELSVAARQGDSGGPILNHQGELAGVLFGASWGRTAGSSCLRVRSFLESLTPWFSPEGAGSLLAWQPPRPVKTPAYSENPGMVPRWQSSPWPGGNIPSGSGASSPGPVSPSPTPPGPFSAPPSVLPPAASASGFPGAGSRLSPPGWPPAQGSLPTASIAQPDASSRRTAELGTGLPQNPPPAGVSENLTPIPPQDQPLLEGLPWAQPPLGSSTGLAAPSDQNSSRFEVIKNFLAFVGAVSLLLLAVRIVSGSGGQ